MRSWPWLLVAVALAGCTRFTPQPLSPQDNAAHFEQRSLADESLHHSAEKNLQKALALDPQLDAAYLNLGALWEKRGQFDKALSYYGKANQMGKGNPIGNAAAEKYNTLIARVKSNNTTGNTGTANLFGQ